MTARTEVYPLPPGTPALELKQLRKAFGRGAEQVVALEGLDLRVEPGEFVCLLGASGCGKSSLLHMLTGLDDASSGPISMPIGRAALMFQESALFPWLTVEQNIDLPLKLAGLSPAERRDRIASLLDLVGLKAFAGHRPHQLSGACGSVWRSSARWRRGRDSCCSMSPSLRSTP